jgi:hypothetical protein
VTATGAGARSTAPTAVPEPALRPSPRGFPERHVVRRARVFLHAGDLVVRGPDGGEQRFRLHRPDGVTRAVWVNLTQDVAPAERAGSAGLNGGMPRPRGVLELRDGRGRALLRLPLSAWTPEAADGTAGSRSALQVSDAAALLAKAGVPVETVTRGTRLPAQPDDADAGAGQGHVPVALFRAALPGWFVAGRALAVTLAVATLLLAAAWHRQTRVLLLVSACALVAVPVLGGAVLLRAWLLDRRDPVDGSVLLRPRPVGPVTRRFLRTAHIRVQHGQLVLTDGAGAERWLPLSGPGAVTEVVRLAAAGSGDVVELRTRDGRVRAVLPWSDWFAGPGGAEALKDLAAQAGVDLQTVRALVRGSGQPKSRARPRGGDLLSAAATYRSLSAEEVREVLAARPGLPGDASVYQPLIFGAMVALGAFLGPSQSAAAGSVAAVAAVLAVLPRVVPRLVSRFWLDQPVPPASSPAGVPAHQESSEET